VRKQNRKIKLLSVIFAHIFLGGWSHLDIPKQCQGRPNRPWVVEAVPEGFCGYGAEACSKPESTPCRIWIEKGTNQRLWYEYLLHEWGHCNCPEWKD
jgi:hypothetical protein